MKIVIRFHVIIDNIHLFQHELNESIETRYNYYSYIVKHIAYLRENSAKG